MCCIDPILNAIYFPLVILDILGMITIYCPKSVLDLILLLGRKVCEIGFQFIRSLWYLCYFHYSSYTFSETAYLMAGANFGNEIISFVIFAELILPYRFLLRTNFYQDCIIVFSRRTSIPSDIATIVFSFSKI